MTVERILQLRPYSNGRAAVERPKNRGRPPARCDRSSERHDDQTGSSDDLTGPHARRERIYGPRDERFRIHRRIARA
jgi:hypothetical protein